MSSGFNVLLTFLTFWANSLKLFPVDSEKPGVCPKPRPDIDPKVASCLNECSSDSQCEGNLKCCFNGCGHNIFIHFSALLKNSI
uniref:WAP domain-containing protein n=1 Tax=Periophthalmus magnuspinnatus TaxID=409849 RepID=A0A3B4B787_9GOBI